jgi:hypothetical protein
MSPPPRGVPAPAGAQRRSAPGPESSRVPTPLDVSAPSRGARLGPERSGGPRRDPSLHHSHPLFYDNFCPRGLVSTLCSRPSRHLLQRAAPPEGTSSFRLFWCFLFHTVHTLVNIFSSGYFIPLYLCDFSIHCLRIHSRIHSLSAFAIMQCSSCLSLGAYSVCVCHISVFCVCTLCFFPPPPLSFFFYYTFCVFFLCLHACTSLCYIIPRHLFGGLYIWKAIYI